jgi:hypothetical protein
MIFLKLLICLLAVLVVASVAYAHVFPGAPPTYTVPLCPLPSCAVGVITGS